MARPEVGSTAEQLYEALGVLSAGDEARDWPLLHFCEALTNGLGIEQINDYVAESDEGLPGWGELFDPDLCPAEALPYLGQFVGVQFAPLLTEAEQRAALRAHEGWRRGTPAAMIAAAKRTLTGAKRVLITERDGGNAYQLRVRTLQAEMPISLSTPTPTERAIRSQKPIGLVLIYEVVTGQSWADVLDSGDSWDDVLAGYDDWLDVETTPP